MKEIRPDYCMDLWKNNLFSSNLSLFYFEQWSITFLNIQIPGVPLTLKFMTSFYRSCADQIYCVCPVRHIDTKKLLLLRNWYVSVHELQDWHIWESSALFHMQRGPDLTVCVALPKSRVQTHSQSCVYHGAKMLRFHEDVIFLGEFHYICLL